MKKIIKLIKETQFLGKYRYLALALLIINAMSITTILVAGSSVNKSRIKALSEIKKGNIDPIDKSGVTSPVLLRGNTIAPTLALTPTSKTYPTTTPSSGANYQWASPTPFPASLNGTQNIQDNSQHKAEIDEMNKKACDGIMASRDAATASLRAQSDSMKQQLDSYSAQMAGMSIDAKINSNLMAQYNSLMTSYLSTVTLIKQIESQYQCIYINPYK